MSNPTTPAAKMAPTANPANVTAAASTIPPPPYRPKFNVMNQYAVDLDPSTGKGAKLLRAMTIQTFFRTEKAHQTFFPSEKKH